MRRTSSRLVGGSLALLLALAQFRLIAMVFGQDYGRSVDAALGVVQGRPHWRVYQNRVLGPYLVDGLARVFPTAIAAHVFLSIAILVASGWLAWRIGERLAGRRGAVSALFVFHAGFAFLLARPWLYVWDYLDVLVFLAFVDCVIAGRRWPWFAGLFAVGILNHEIAMFIALWLIADPIAAWVLGRRGVIPAAPIDRVRLAAGVACVVASFVIVEGLRSALLVEEIGPKIFIDAPRDAGGSFHFTLWDNLRALGRIVSHFDYSMAIVIPAFLLAAVAIAGLVAVRDPKRYTGLAVTYLGIAGSLLAFGVLLETRIYVVLIPIVVAGAAMLAGEPKPVPDA